ncbi:hypothetical protein [uncultured Gammaproteobacteria bacterium]|nr:hypothetical protein [uncultured Gammaproteobacteria bacterium]CAC9521528.1 hypothetical protein [uncultured Gammaproteobacteria bacterium]
MCNKYGIKESDYIKNYDYIKDYDDINLDFSVQK